MPDQSSIGGDLMRSLARRNAEQQAANSQLQQVPPTPQGPSQAEMAANPDAPPATIVRPQTNQFAAKVKMLLQQGLISPAQYDAYLAKIGAPAQ